MIRVPVLSPKGKPLMPAKASRVRRWLKSGKAKVVHNNLGIFQVQLVDSPSGEETQDIVAGIDPGKLFTGIAVQSASITLFLAHLNLPFKNVRRCMTQRAMMRRGRQGRRIKRKVPFNQRNHRQHRNGVTTAAQLPATASGRVIMSGQSKLESLTTVTFPVTPKPKFRLVTLIGNG